MEVWRRSLQVDINNDTREDTRTTCLIEDSDRVRDGEGRGTSNNKEEGVLI